MKAPAFAYLKAPSLTAVFAALETYGDEARLLAGGQSLLPALNLRLAAPQVLIDLNGLDALRGITLEGATVRIGALTRHRELERSALVAAHLPLLRLAMPHVAHAAVRNRGTFGGSIVHADPAAELPACSVALDARFVLASRAGERRVAARDFFRGYHETALAPGEVLVAGEFPARAADCRSAFGELARRHGDFAIVGLAAHGRSRDGVLADLRLVFFGVGAAPVVASGAAAALAGRRFDAAVRAAAQAALDADLDPVGDLHHSAAVRRQLARVLLGRVLDTLAGANAGAGLQ